MVKIDIQRSKHGPTFRGVISGKVGRIGVSGRVHNFHAGLDDLSPHLVGQIVTVNRADGSGRDLPTGAVISVQRAVFAALEAVI